MPAPIAAHHDVLIAGGGPVGCALALALRESGLRVLLASGSSPAGIAAPPTSHQRPHATDRVTRPIALSHASYAYLRALGALATETGTPIRSIHVSQRGGFGRTVMSAAEHGLDALGHVFDIDALHVAAMRAAASYCIDARVAAWRADEGGVLVRLQTRRAEATPATVDGTSVEEHERGAKLLVLADGGALAEQTTGQIVRDYGQSALVGTVRTNVAHQHRAWERFTPEGPLALLPHGDRYAFVWALPNDVAERRLADSDEAFCQALQRAFGDRAGRFVQAGPRTCVPLALKRSRRLEELAVIAIGNASQALHPVAGQGLNLGLRDVMELVEMLQADPRLLATPDTTKMLVKRFAQRRWSDRAGTIAATDLFVRAFSNERPLMTAARGLALSALDLLPPARSFLARRMMLGARAFP